MNLMQEKFFIFLICVFLFIAIYNINCLNYNAIKRLQISCKELNKTTTKEEDVMSKGWLKLDVNCAATQLWDSKIYK